MVALRAAAAAERNKFSQDWILRRLKQLAEEAEQEGVQATALRTLAQTQGMLVDRVHVTSERPPVDDDLADMSDEELTEALRKMRAPSFAKASEGEQ